MEKLVSQEELLKILEKMEVGNSKYNSFESLQKFWNDYEDLKKENLRLKKLLEAANVELPE